MYEILTSEILQVIYMSITSRCTCRSSQEYTWPTTTDMLLAILESTTMKPVTLNALYSLRTISFKRDRSYLHIYNRLSLLSGHFTTGKSLDKSWTKDILKTTGDVGKT